jgi:translocation and assembly module TamB
MRWLKALALSVLVLVLVALASVWWLVGTSGGASFVLGRAQSLMGKGARIEGIEGRLGGKLAVKLIVMERPDLYVRVDDVVMDTSPNIYGGLVVHRLFARNVEVRSRSTGAAASLPASLKPPYPVRLEDGGVGTFTFGAIDTHDKDVVLRDIVLKGAGDRSRWIIDKAAVTTQYGSARLAGTLGNSLPFEVMLDAGFEGQVQGQPAKVEAKLSGTLKKTLAKAEALVVGTRASAQAELAPFESPPLKSLTLDAKDVDLRGVDSTLPRTRVEFEARLAPRGDGVAGHVRLANAEPGTIDSGHVPLVSAQADIEAAAGRAELSALEVMLAGGGRAQGTARLKDGSAQADLQLAAIDLSALHGALQKTEIGGKLSVAGDKEAQQFDVALSDPRFSVNGHAGLTTDRLEVKNAEVRAGGGTVSTSGAMALKGTKEFRFEGRAQHFDPSAFAKVQKGDLNFTFVASGRLAEPLGGEAHIDIASSTFAGLPASGRVELAGDKQRIARADVDVALGDAHATAKGSFGRPGDAMDVSLRAPNLSTLARPFGLALAGRFDATGHLTGSFHAVAGSIAVNGANLALPSNVYIRELALHGTAGSEPASPIDASVQARGIAVGKDVPPTSLAETFTATLQGTRASHRLQAEAVMTRETTVRTALSGGLIEKSGSTSWSGRIESLAMTGRGAFTLVSPATLELSSQRAELGDALLRGEWGEAHLQTTRWTPELLELRGASPGLKIETLARDLRMGTAPVSDLVIAMNWDVRGASTFDAKIDANRVSGDVRVGDPATPLGLTDLSIHAAVAKGDARATFDVVGSRIGSVHGQGSARIVRGEKGWEIEKAAPVAARIVAAIPDLQSLAPWIGPDTRMTGKLDADVTVSGTGADPRFAGSVRAASLSLREPQTGFEISQGEVQLALAGRSVTIQRFVARTPWKPPKPALERLEGVTVPPDGGTISAEGSVDLETQRGAIRIKADKVPVTQLPTRFVAVSGEAKLEAGEHGIDAGGKFGVDAGWIGAPAEAPPSPSDDVVVIRASQPAAEAPPKTPIHIDISIALNENTYFVGRGLDTRLAGDLRIAGTVGSQLRATGSIRTLDGTYEGYGQKLSIERGVLIFAGPVDNPKLSVLALRKGLPVEAGVEVTGTTSRLRVRLVSTPDVPESEKLSWLVLGRGASDASPNDMSVLAAAATALLGGNNPGDDISKKFGIDEVKIGRPDAVLGVLPQSTVAGRTGSPAAADVVTVGKRLNHNLHLSYEQGIADAEGAIKLAYTVTKQFAILMRAGYLPGVDAVYRWTFK